MAVPTQERVLELEKQEQKAFEVFIASKTLESAIANRQLWLDANHEWQQARAQRFFAQFPHLKD